MFSYLQSARKAAWIALTIFACIFSSGLNAQEYLYSEEVAPDSLEESPGSFEDISIRDQIYEEGFLIPGLVESFPNLSPVLNDSVLKLEPRTYYFYRTFSDGRKAEAWTLGGAVKYQSGWWRDFLKWGAVGYTSQRLYGPPDRDGTGLLQLNQQPYTALGQAYLKAKLRHSVATLYRQELDLPYVNRNDVRMTPRTFEGYTVTSEELNELKMIGGHLTKMKGRTSTDFEPMSVSTGAAGSNRGVSFAGFRYDMTENFGAGAINYYGWDTLNTLYSEAQMDFDCPANHEVTVSAQFANQSDVGASLAGARNGQLYGTKVSVGKNSLIGTLAFTTTRGSRILKSWGGDPSFNSLMMSDFDRQFEDTFRLGLSCNFREIGLPGVSGFINLASGNTPDSGPFMSDDQREINATVDFRPEKGALENFWLRVRYGHSDLAGNGVDRTDFRVIANYFIEF